MNITRPLLQDLADLLRIHHERAEYFNLSAYGCAHLPFKTMLHRELNNTRDSIHALKRLLYGRFEDVAIPETVGELYTLWTHTKSAHDDTSITAQVRAFERDDATLLECYQLILSRPLVEEITKALFEFQYQNHFTLYESMKCFKLIPPHALQNVASYQQRSA